MLILEVIYSVFINNLKSMEKNLTFYNINRKITEKYKFLQKIKHKSHEIGQTIGKKSFLLYFPQRKLKILFKLKKGFATFSKFSQFSRLFNIFHFQKFSSKSWFKNKIRFSKSFRCLTLFCYHLIEIWNFLFNFFWLKSWK